MDTPTTKTELLKTHEHELVKQYIVYDGQLRPISVYTVANDAPNGAACLLTEYTYLSPTSTLVQKRKESYATWDSSWDM